MSLNWNWIFWCVVLNIVFNELMGMYLLKNFCLMFGMRVIEGDLERSG